MTYKDRHYEAATKSIHVGIFRISHTNCDVFLDFGTTGGRFECRPDDKSLPLLGVGGDSEYWDDVVSVLIHEALEFLLLEFNAAHEPCGSWSTTDNRIFLMRHCDYSEICRRLSSFLVPVLPRLCETWKKARRRSKRK